MVFKEHLASRSFELNTRWLTAFGLWNLTLLLFALASIAWGVKSLTGIHSTSPLGMSSTTSPAMAPAVSVPIQAPAAPVAAPVAPAASTQSAEATAAFEASTAKVAALEIEKKDLQKNIDDLKSQLQLARVPPVLPLAPPASAADLTALSILSAKILPKPEGESPVQLEGLKLKVRQNEIRVQFGLVYTRKDGAAQQGRFFIVARGGEHLAGYPRGIFQPAGQTSLVRIEKAETFSVGRLRPVDARIEGAAGIKEVEIVVLNRENQVLIYQTHVQTDNPGVVNVPTNP